MNRKLALIITLQSLLIILLFWLIVFYGKDEYEQFNQAQEEEVETPNRVAVEQGATVITISQAAQVQSDIQIAALESASEERHLSTYGSVISIDPLIELRARYLASVADANVANASLTNSKQDYHRLLLLSQDNHNVSERVLLAAEALYKSDQAKVRAAEIQSNNIRDTIRQSWGDVLANMATQAQTNDAFQALLAHKRVLVQITLPFNTNSLTTQQPLHMMALGDNTHTEEGQFVSASPQTDTTISGKTYFFSAKADNLRAGMKVSVSLGETNAETKSTLQGVTVPANAVVWYSGKPWVYKKTDNTKFIRVPIQTNRESASGWFNTNGLQAGDQVVTNGAQLLLSEEFKFQIKNENED